MLASRFVSGLLTVLTTLVTVLGIWTAVSLLATSMMVLCVRTNARLSAELYRESRRRAWLAAVYGT